MESACIEVVEPLRCVEPVLGIDADTSTGDQEAVDAVARRLQLWVRQAKIPGIPEMDACLVADLNLDRSDR